MTLPEHLIANLKQLARDNGISNRDIANDQNCSEANVSKFFNPKNNPTNKTFKKMALSVHKLILNKENEK